MKKSLLTTVAGLALASVASAAVFVDNFESYTIGNNLNGTGGWTVTNGGTNPAAEVVAGSWPGSGSNSAALGWYDDTTGGPVTLSHALSVGLVGATQPTYFSVETAIIDSTTDGVARDPFAFNLTNSSDDLIFSLFFSPQSSPVSGGDGGSGVWDVGWSTGLTTVGANAGFLGAITSGTPDWTDFRVDFWAGTGTQVNFAIKNVGNTLYTGTFTNANTESITKFTAEWGTVGGASAGENFIQFDNLAVVPEPTSFALLGLGALVGLRRRRQA